MNGISLVAKYLIIPLSTVVGIFYGFDLYVIERARTVVEPTVVKVNYIEKSTIQSYQALNEKMDYIMRQNNIMYSELLKRGHK